MSKKITVSVIISVYNEEEHIKRCLLSLNKQSFRNFELIVVDDGSTDKTRQIVSNFKSTNFETQLLSQKHKGPAAARNKAAKKAKGSILVFVDGDMYFAPDFLEKLVQPILAKKSKGTYTVLEKVANWDNKWARCWNYNWGLPGDNRINPSRGDQVKDFRAIQKKEFDQVGGFDSTGYTDTWTLSEKLSYCPQPTKALCYHYNPGSIKEVFLQAKWAAKREYKLGIVGKIITLFKASPPIALVFGIYLSILKKEPFFVVFKLIYGLGLTLGLVEYMLGHSSY